ncbi:LuxR C-terminal-related transcriptional regulator [Comamonas sp. GB3 AK4-5]|uniref:helix-turn-helix transcriptional regulator n=1 Tax=Comamonas sp. GB3 AK4-5 TaxID=3231487 RepID=UPI00351E2B24
MTSWNPPSMDCAAERPLFEAAAEATHALGSVHFWPAFFKLLRVRLAFENALVTWYYPRQAPTVVLEFDWVASAAESQVTRYVEGMYRLDPFFQAFENGLGPGLHWLSDVAPDCFRQTDYYANYFRDAVGQDEVQLVCASHGGLLSVSLGAGQHYAASEARSLHPLQPWLLAILSRHADAGTDTAAAKGLAAPSLALPFRDALARFGVGALSPREAEVARLTLQGHSLQSIAQHLGIASETVKSHRRHVYAKLDVRSPSELFALFTAGLGPAPALPMAE